MKKIDIGSSGLLASEISLGCMRIDGMSKREADTLLNTALDVGIDFFDHADVYRRSLPLRSAGHHPPAKTLSCNQNAASGRVCLISPVNIFFQLSKAV